MPALMLALLLPSEALGDDALADRAAEAFRAGVYRNLGNAHRLAGDLPRSILCYRLALRRDPGDPVLRRALEDARKEVIYPEGPALGRPSEPLPALPTPGLFALAAAANVGAW